MVVNFDGTTEVLVGLAILVGLIGIVVPVLPGSILVGGAILVWAFLTGGPVAWTVFAVAAVFLVVAEILQYVVAGGHMKRSEVPTSTIVLGGVAGVIGFFVVPVVGLFLFFAVAVFLVELVRRQDRVTAWRATVAALQASAMTIGIQLLGALAAATAWIIGLFLV
ncbi:DUF456 domain-containing protein [Myceligenerans indicum]|uniref:DUF456 domain-containing protein n=1 Tax=Myceligenerans indicum TaxID=2593663 RepID=A0ABS1LER1_9MICO|nr:DUF456 domain-containing protein [Myceligenerans indicum]MBL0884704.1 DUF456 domain-containing protein [Myceligenerans indicum]